MAFLPLPTITWASSPLRKLYRQSSSHVNTPRRRPNPATTRRVFIFATVTPSGSSENSSSSSSNGTSSTSGNNDESEQENTKGDSEMESETSTDEDGTNTATADPFESAQQALQGTINGVFDRLFTPIRATCPLLSSGWESTYGNYILHPETSSVKSVIHFLGGAFFGAVPHHLYNSLLSRLCARGHVIVATPYDLSFNYLPVADGIARCWESVEADLAVRYGPLPVIGVGHSAGAVFHALTAALFDDAAPKAGNILISFNCRSATDAIPSYDEMVAPLAKLLVSTEQALPSDVRQRVRELPKTIDDLVTDNIFTPNTFREQVVPVAKQGRRFIEQIEPLLREIANENDIENNNEEKMKKKTSTTKRKTKSGQREFYPPPDEVCAAVRQLYPVPETLVVKFSNDSLDDSPQLVDVLTQCRGANHSVVELTGSHLTPLAQDAPDISALGLGIGQGIVGAVGGVIGEVVGALGVRDLNKLEAAIDEWIDVGISNGKL